MKDVYLDGVRGIISKLFIVDGNPLVMCMFKLWSVCVLLTERLGFLFFNVQRLGLVLGPDCNEL